MKNLLFFLALLLSGLTVSGQQPTVDYSQKMAETVMHIWPDSLEMEPGRPVKWAYDQGVVLEGMINIWKRTGKGKYFDYVKESMDFFIKSDGTISRYKASDFNIDHVKNGRSLLTLYKVTKSEKYFKAANLLREQLKAHPRTQEGGFWHKKIYPNQMWLDGLYMGQPFYTEYSISYHEPENLDDIVNQFVYMENHARDPNTGLMYHGWDESKAEKWADKETGLSPHFWGRAMGWYGMGLVDVLENFPVDHPRRPELLAILNRFSEAVIKVQDPASGLWYQILDKPTGKGNYKEASASNMFVYALAKAVRLGYIPKSFQENAQRGYAGILQEFITTDEAGRTHLNGTVSVAGLGGKPYRDGSYEYYLSEKVVTNDPKGVGAFLLASNEMELQKIPQYGTGKTILLDGYFNNELKSDITGKSVPWHYKWHELENGGFSLMADHLRYRGARPADLNSQPTARALKSAYAYIIVDPDNNVENPNPNYVSKRYVKDISAWVKRGGTLVIMANDEGNADLIHINELTKKFGIEFNRDSKNHVTGSEFEMGRVSVPDGNVIFSAPYKLYLKEISTLKLTTPARAVLTHKGDDIMAMANYGKGKVFVVGDPWLYNEYVDGRKLPTSFQNFDAGLDLINWILKEGH